MQRLPRGIGALKKLKTLDVEENQLETLPNEIGELSMLSFVSFLTHFSLFTT